MQLLASVRVANEQKQPWRTALSRGGSVLRSWGATGAGQVRRGAASEGFRQSLRCMRRKSWNRRYVGLHACVHVCDVRRAPRVIRAEHYTLVCVALQRRGLNHIRYNPRLVEACDADPRARRAIVCVLATAAPGASAAGPSPFSTALFRPHHRRHRLDGSSDGGRLCFVAECRAGWAASHATLRIPPEPPPHSQLSALGL